MKMRKHFPAILVLVLFSVLLIAAAQSQEDMEFVDNAIFENPQRTPAVFNHDSHNETAEIEDCSGCHHLYEDGQLMEDESSEDQQCSECHGFSDEGSKPGLTKAFHLNCKGCHLEQGAGPILCGECHVK